MSQPASELAAQSDPTPAPCPFKRRWKRNPEYPDWKCTDQLVGRRVAKLVETTHVREGAGPAKRFEVSGLRRGWVVQKEEMLLYGRDEDMFVVRYPKMGALPVKFEVRSRQKELVAAPALYCTTALCQMRTYVQQ